MHDILITIASATISILCRLPARELRLATVRYPQPQDWVLCGDFGTKVLISRRNTKVFLSLCGSVMFTLHLHEISDISGINWVKIKLNTCSKLFKF